MEPLAPHVERSSVRSRRAIWALSLALFALFAARGAWELFAPIDALGDALGWPARFMPQAVRGIGVIHLAGALLLVLPLGRAWRPVLAPPAAMVLGYWMVIEMFLFVTELRFRTAAVALLIGVVTLTLSWARSLQSPIERTARTERTERTRGARRRLRGAPA